MLDVNLARALLDLLDEVEQDLRTLKRPSRELIFTGNSTLEIGIDNYIGHRDMALVTLGVNFDDQAWSVVGAAKRAAEDRPDPQVALLMATGNALRTIARHFERQAEGRLKHRADVEERAQRDAERANGVFANGNETINAMAPKPNPSATPKTTGTPAKRATAAKKATTRRRSPRAGAKKVGASTR